jgi:hypothetical protein
MNTINLIVFPSDKSFHYLKYYISERINKNKLENIVYAYYNFDKAEECTTYLYYDSGTELRLKTAFGFINKYCSKNSGKKIIVHLFTPDISYYYDSDLDLLNYLNDNIVEFNYIIKKCNLPWVNDFKSEWTNNDCVKLINL